MPCTVHIALYQNFISLKFNLAYLSRQNGSKLAKKAPVSLSLYTALYRVTNTDLFSILTRNIIPSLLFHYLLCHFSIYPRIILAIYDKISLDFLRQEYKCKVPCEETWFSWLDKAWSCTLCSSLLFKSTPIIIGWRLIRHTQTYSTLGYDSMVFKVNLLKINK